MTTRPLPIKPERINSARARGIAGVSERKMQKKSERGQIPGAIKIDGLWTYDEAKLRAWLNDREKHQCQQRKAAANAKPRGIASGVATPSMAASGSKANSAGGRYALAMSTLLSKSSRRTSSG
jgi:cytochrome oxidase assembly protein ShyY1